MAIVETKASHPDHSASIEVKEVLKGKAPIGELRVFGQDGSNCNGELIHKKGTPWVLLFSKQGDTFQSISCGDAALPFLPDGRIELTLREKIQIQVTRQELQSLLEYKTVPSAKGMWCSLHLRRMFVNLSEPEQPAYEFDFFRYIETPAGDLSIFFEQDLTNRGPRLGWFRANASVRKLRNGEYSIQVGLLDPFFSSIAHTSGTISMRNSYSANPLSMTRDTSLDGGDHAENTPFLNHYSGVNCGLQVGLPLVPVAAD